MNVGLILPPQEGYVSPPGTEFNDRSPLMCYMSMASMLIAYGHCVAILDYRLGKHDVEAVAEHVVGSFDVSGITTWLGGFWFVKQLASVIKRIDPGFPLICGGPLMNAIPDLVMDNVPCDVGVIGEGEHAMLSIVGQLASGAWKPNGRSRILPSGTVRSGEPPRESLDSLPTPALDIWPGIREGRVRTMYYETSRGCPYHCAYCAHTFTGQSCKANVTLAAELSRIREHHMIEHLFFADPCFDASPSRVDSVCGVLAESGLTWECMMRVDKLDRDGFARMKRSGCSKVWLGVESRSDEVLGTAGKHTHKADADAAVVAALDVGLNVVCWFVVGLDGETEESLDEMVGFCAKYPVIPRPNYLIPLPGTRYWDVALNRYFRGSRPALLEWLDKNGAGRVMLNLCGLPDSSLVATHDALYHLMLKRDTGMVSRTT